MSRIDFHLHADFSADSKMKLEHLLPLALKLNYGELAITEHLDLHPRELTVYGIPSLYKYKNLIEHFRSRYPELRLHCGIEVGDFQDVRDMAIPILEMMRFDLVIGSVHFIRDHINVAVPLKQTLTEEEITEYYERNYLLVRNCPIQVLAHLGVYKRYYLKQPEESHCLPVIELILKEMISRDIALELNLSCLRKPYGQLLPEPEYLSLYKDMGGRMVTIGSDSHELEHFDSNYQVALDAMQYYGFDHLKI
jgi:histidinol-phosphatase (PHP family)